MVVFPNCKINIGLQVGPLRTDGYHHLQTIFYPLPFTDALEIIAAPGKTGIQFTCSGLAVQGNESDNLCVQAYHLLKKDFPQIPAVQMHLHKAIPMGAGLGGGSADAAFTLSLINKKYQLHLSADQLEQYALRLGSDCPFFILNTPCHAWGRGEEMMPVPLNLSGYNLVLINPGIHVHTGEAFAALAGKRKNNPDSEQPNLKVAIMEPPESWKENISNDFEAVIFTKFPSIAAIKKTLYKQGAVYASMSGSGSTVYGLFKTIGSLSLSFPPAWLVKTFLL